MKYKIFLKCAHCNRTSNAKEYNVSEQEIKRIIKIANNALNQPQYLMCQQCNAIFTVKVMLVTLK